PYVSSFPLDRHDLPWGAAKRHCRSLVHLLPAGNFHCFHHFGSHAIILRVWYYQWICHLMIYHGCSVFYIFYSVDSFSVDGSLNIFKMPCSSLPVIGFGIGKLYVPVSGIL